jgi:molybdopterin synthase catalytic subunit
MIAVTTNPIDPATVIDAARAPETGAIVTFLGVVRDDGIDAMEIEAFEEVALADLREIAAAAAEEHRLDHVDIIHRIGRLSVGEPILLIVCGAGHRKGRFWAVKRSSSASRSAYLSGRRSSGRGRAPGCGTIRVPEGTYSRPASQVK